MTEVWLEAPNPISDKRLLAAIRVVQTYQQAVDISSIGPTLPRKYNAIRSNTANRLPSTRTIDWLSGGKLVQ